MGERRLALIAEKIAKDRDACEMQRVTMSRQLETAKVRNDELHQELRACEADKLVAQKAVCDAHARARATKEALVLVEKQSAVAAAVLMHKEAQLLEYSECSHVLYQQVRDIEEQQLETSNLKCEVERLRKDLGQHDVLQKHIEQARQEIVILQDATENARANASAAVVERDNLRRDLDEVRRRLMDAEREASTLRTKASSAMASSNAYMAHLEELRRELREAEQSNNSCAHSLRKQVGVAKSDAALAMKQVDALHKELDALRTQNTSENSEHPQCGAEGTHKRVSASPKGSDGVQSKCVEGSSRSRCDMIVTGSSATTSLVGSELAVAQIKPSKCSGKDSAIKAGDLFGETLFKGCIEAQVDARSDKLLRSDPVKVYERKSVNLHPRDPRAQQHQLQQCQEQAQWQQQQLQKRKALHCHSLHPLQLQRSKSRLWRPGCHGSAVVKRRKRGAIFISDLEKVGYTPGCYGCRVASSEGVCRQGHTEACRARVYADMIRLNLPGAHRLRDAERKRDDEDPKRPRTCSYPSNSGRDHEAQQVLVKQSPPCFVSTVRASAMK